MSELEWDASQLRAIEGILNTKQRVLLLTGSAGRGKTSVIKEIVKRAIDNGLPASEIRFAATTGKAAKIMQESIAELRLPYEAMTVHRLLKCQGHEWLHGADDPLQARLLFIDESSMADSLLFARILYSVDQHCQIIFTGDYQQLPPVGAGAPFADLAKADPGQITFKLEINWRQLQGSLIADACDRILERKTVLFGEKGEAQLTGGRLDDLFFHEVEESEDIAAKVLELSGEWYKKRMDYACIVPQRTQKAGLTALNLILQEHLNPPSLGKQEMKTNGILFREGDKIKITKNLYRLDVFNGFIGYIEEITPGAIIAVFDGKYVRLDAEALSCLELAYMQTVHSCQGSGYKYGLFVCDRAHTYMLGNQLIYVAISRFKEELHVVGQRKTFDRGVKNVISSHRNTILSKELKGNPAAE